MQKSMTLAFNISVIGVLAYLAFARSNQTPPAPAGVAPSGEETTEARIMPADFHQEIASLRQRLSQQDERISALLAERAKKEEQGVADPAAAPSAPNPRDPAVIQAQKEQWNAHMADVQAEFFMEKHDPKWSATMTTAIRSIAEKNEAIRDAVDQIECHSQTCRVELKGDTAGKADQQLPMFVQQVGADLPNAEIAKVEDEHGHTKTVVYFSQGSPGA